MNILIVDDNPTNLKLLRAQLESEDHVVIEAQDGAEALKLLGDQRMDALISDIRMPHMDGYRLCHEIRKSSRLRSLPTIIYSATYTSSSEVQLALDVGADKYVKKPASAGIIVAALHEVIARTRAAAEAGLLPEVEVLKEYSQWLVAKLETKNLALEQANIELNATRDQLAHLLKHSPAVIYSLKVEDARAIPHLISENMTHLLGFTTEESCNFDWWVTQLHPEDRELAMAGVAATIKDGAWTAEYRIRHKLGHYLWVEDNRRLVRDINGGATDIVVVWTNMTERKLTQNQLLRAQRLESIGTLACGLAHDINNALVPIMMAARLIRQDFPDTASEQVELIEASSQYGADMLKQLLTFVKGVEGERLSVPAQELLKNVIQQITVTLPKNIRLDAPSAKDLWDMVGDRTQLQRVLLNLCVNARDAMLEGGRLTIQVNNVELDATAARAIPEGRPGWYVAWSVTDTGAGISPQLLDRIFEPFFSTKGLARGTGLGLSTVSGIVRSHAGFLQVISTVGQGSTFTVYLPAVARNIYAVALPAKTEPIFRGHGESILVVEDDPSVRRIMQTVLTRLDFKVRTARDGADAVKQMTENPDELRLVITDLNMPKMDGLALAHVLQIRLPQARIIVSSGHFDQETAAELKHLGVSALLEKPFTSEQLIAVLKKLIGGERADARTELN